MNRRTSISLIARALLFSVVVLLAGNGRSYGQQSDADPASLAQRHAAAIARGDAAGALALYNDDAVIQRGGLCAAAPCVGKAAIQKELERRVGEKTQGTIIGKYVSGSVAPVQFEVRSDSTQKAGVDRIIVWNIYEVKGDKIAAVTIVFQRTDPQTARFFEWQQ
jgi:hypothetical protein